MPKAPSIKVQRPAGAGVLGTPEAEAKKKTAIALRKGRPLGSQGLHTVKLRDAIDKAFHKVGGVSYLVRVAEAKPETFCALLARTMPTQVSGPDGGPVRVVEVRSF